MIRKCLDGLYLGAGWLAGLFMVAIFVLMMAISIGREINLNLKAGDDFVSWCMAAMAFLGLAHTFRHGEMIRVGLIIDLIEGRARWYIEMACLLIGIGFIGFFAYYTVQMNWQSWKFNDMSGGVVVVPLWIPQLGYSVGLVILLIAFVDEFFHVAMGGEPRYEKPKPKTAEEAVEQAIQNAV